MKQVKKVHVETRQNVVVNRLNKTKVERYPDLAKEKEDALREVRKKDQAEMRSKVSASDQTLLCLSCARVEAFRGHRGPMIRLDCRG